MSISKIIKVIVNNNKYNEIKIKTEARTDKSNIQYLYLDILLGKLLVSFFIKNKTAQKKRDRPEKKNYQQVYTTDKIYYHRNI